MASRYTQGTEEGVKTGPSPLSRRHFLQAAGAAGAGLALESPAAAQGVMKGKSGPGVVQAATEEFAVSFRDGAMVSLNAVNDVMGTEWVQPEQRLGDVTLRYRQQGGEWVSAETRDLAGVRTVAASPDGREYEATYQIEVGDGGTLELRLGFVVEEKAVLWNCTLRNEMDSPLEIGDLALPLPVNENREAHSGPPFSSTAWFPVTAPCISG